MRFADRLTLVHTRYDCLGAALAESATDGHRTPTSLHGACVATERKRFALASLPVLVADGKNPVLSTAEPVACWYQAISSRPGVSAGIQLTNIPGAAIAVNDELESLRTTGPTRWMPTPFIDGRIAIRPTESLEDRIVKRVFAEGSRVGHPDSVSETSGRGAISVR